MPGPILTLNAGSSSVRLAAFEEGGARRIAEAHHDRPGTQPRGLLEDFLGRHGLQDVSVASHRIVHGGERFHAPVRVDAAVEREIERLGAIAPLHNPPALRWLREARAVLGPDVPHVAVFDTAFYAGLPAAATTYALPRELAARHGLRRYGFHGIAHDALGRRWRQLHGDAASEARVISLQLGAGCSITATRGGRAVDTSMGFTPLEGLVMATRPGDIDPGLLLHLQRAEGMSAEALERMLSRDSGLRGISGASGDMRELLASSDPAARLAIEVYCRRARKYVGAFLAVLGGADAVLFGGGVGEHAPEIRARILEGMDWAGIALDARRNRAASSGEARIDAGGAVAVWVIPVDEAAILAQEAFRAIAK